VEALAPTGGGEERRMKVGASPDSRRELLQLRLYRAAVVVAPAVAPAVYIANEILRDPPIAFLPPSLTAQGAPHPPHDFIRYRGFEMIEDVEFSRTFHADPDTADLELRFRAFGQQVEVAVNGRVVFNGENDDWKRIRSIRLRDAVRPGTNRLTVRVHNALGIPVLLVEEPPALRTPDHWRASLGPDFSDERDTVSPLARQARPGPLQRWPWLVAVSVVWLAGWAAVAVLCCLDGRAAARAAAVPARP